MSRYTAKPGLLGAHALVQLCDDTGRRVRIARRGATLLSFDVPRASNAFNIASGYSSEADLQAHPGSHFAVMAPFAGRVNDARYRFDGVDYDLQPGVEGEKRGVMHGFVREADFEVAALAANDASASVKLATSAIRPRPGYPFAIDLSVTFTLSAAGLKLDARMRNVGDAAAPCFFGWHAYLRVNDGWVDDWSLHIPARTHVRTGVDLIALPGKGAYVALDDAKVFDFRQPETIGNRVLDEGYVDLVAGADGLVRTRLTDPSDGFAVVVWQEQGGVVHAFTGDTLKKGARRAVAIEPMGSIADGFNRPEWAEALRLKPGQTRGFRCGVEVKSS